MTNSPLPQPISYRPELPDWGVYLTWPAASDAWIHPDDVGIASKMIPSRRVFRRSRWDGEYYHLHYGRVHLRVRPSMWLHVPPVDLDVSQQVELLCRHGRNDPGIFRIADIHYSAAENEIEYYLHSDSLRLARCFAREDLRPLHVRHHLRSGYFTHELPKSKIPADVELLDVGELTNS